MDKQEISNKILTPISAFKYSFPLMIGALGSAILLFIDRIMLAMYSTESMNAVAYASTILMIGQIALITICNSSEVICGYLFIRSRFQEMRKATWQSLWVLVLLTPLLSIGLILIVSKLELDLLAKSYLYLLLGFIWTPAFSAAMSGFFNSQQRSNVYVKSIWLANIFNIVFNGILIFGVSSYIEPMGVKGAAISTIIGYLAQAVYLFINFINENNKSLRIFELSLDTKLIKKYLSLGVPHSLSQIAEFGIWLMFFTFSKWLGPNQITILSYMQTFCFLYMFVLVGIGKSVTILASQYFSSNNISLLPHMLKSFFTIHVVMLLILFLTLLIGKTIMMYFFPLVLFPVLSVFGAVGYLFFEAFRFIYIGVLLAKDDSIQIFINNIFVSFFLLVLPISFSIYFELVLSEHILLSMIITYVAAVSIALQLRARKNFKQFILN